MRLFTAIELPDHVRTHVVGVAKRLQGRYAFDGATWIPPQNLHITVKFLGELNDPTVPQICDALRNLRRIGPMVLRAETASTLPPRGPVRIGIVDLSGDIGKLNQLFGQIQNSCQIFGCPVEKRPYHPHITIMRARHGLRELIGEVRKAYHDLPEFFQARNSSLTASLSCVPNFFRLARSMVGSSVSHAALPRIDALTFTENIFADSSCNPTHVADRIPVQTLNKDGSVTAVEFRRGCA